MTIYVDLACSHHFAHIIVYKSKEGRKYLKFNKGKIVLLYHYKYDLNLVFYVQRQLGQHSFSSFNEYKLYL